MSERDADELRETSEWALCRGISVGAWLRAYGQDANRAEAWRVLCSTQVGQIPAKK